MATIGRLPARRLGRLGVVAAVGTALILGTSAVNAALVSGSLPTAGLTYTSLTENAVLLEQLRSSTSRCSRR